MTIQRARALLGEKYAHHTDDEIQEILNTLSVIADIATDSLVKMTPEQRKAFKKK